MADTKHCKLLKYADWDEKEFVWKDKPFYVTRYKEFMHMPLNYGKVLTKALVKIGKDRVEEFALSGEESIFSSSLLIPVDNRKISPVEVKSGKFLTKLFEGSYSDVSKWVKEMTNFVHGKGAEVKKLWFWYPTCPKCAKQYGKVQTVIFAEVS